MRPPIYTPFGAALEYSPFGLNIYDACPHGCTYCYPAAMAKRFGQPWGTSVSVRQGLLYALDKQLARPEWQNAGRLIHLCFTCDPYPVGHKSTATRAVIKAIKESGNHVQILTKGDETAQRDFDLLDSNDWFGVTWSGADFIGHDEPHAAHHKTRHQNIVVAKEVYGISTWMSCEPVLDPQSIYAAIRTFDGVDEFRIGKLNHRKSDIDWNAFGHKAKALCEEHGRTCVIKNDLLKEMEELYATR